MRGTDECQYDAIFIMVVISEESDWV